MFWDRKKKGDKSLPDLPALPRAVPSMKDYQKVVPQSEEESEEEIRTLPSFPETPKEKDFGQTAIRDAVEPDIKEDLPPLPSFRKESAKIPSLKKSDLIPPTEKSKLVEMDEWKPSSISELPPPSSRPQKIGGKKSIFVKLEKFQDARESLKIIKEKLGEIEELLKTIREVKMKEDQELYSWEKEIESTKSRIDTIASDIFGNADEGN